MSSEYIKFANIEFKGLRKHTLLEESSMLRFIVTVNSEFIVKANEDKVFFDILNKNFSTFDGQIPYFLAKRKYPNKNFEKLSGSDLIYDFAKMAQERNKKIFLLGGLEESNKKAILNLRKEYNIQIDGFSPEYRPFPFDEKHNLKILKEISEFKPDILFVGFGAVKQELWINENKDILYSIGIKWVVGSGGTFEFVAGTIKRAPLFIQKIGLEGVYRLISEPKWFRLKRLLLSFKIFKYI